MESAAQAIGLWVLAALAALTPHAATGIATLETLRNRFTPLAEAILRAAVAPPGGSPGGTWISRTLARLSGLVTVRRVGGDVAGDTTEAIVARAEARLGVGDLAAAVAEVVALDGAGAEVAASWLGDARARLAAEASLAALDARVIAAPGWHSCGSPGFCLAPAPCPGGRCTSPSAPGRVWCPWRVAGGHRRSACCS